jgi:hypothetical protein
VCLAPDAGRWSCSEDGGGGAPCNQDEELMRLRNCDGAQKRCDFYLGGENFSRCPTSWLNAHPEALSIWEQYVDCCGGLLDKGVRFLPCEGPAGSQPHKLMAAFRAIASAVGKQMRLMRESD